MADLFIGKLLLLCGATAMLYAYRPGKICKSQGIEGHIYRISGNHMPSPGVKPAAPAGISTTLYIYELTSINQVTRQGQSSFYASIPTKLVKKTVSDSSGYFKVQLPPGKYSLFTKKDTLFYANWFDQFNNIAPVEVLSKKMTNVKVRMDYDAAY